MRGSGVSFSLISKLFFFLLLFIIIATQFTVPKNRAGALFLLVHVSLQSFGHQIACVVPQVKDFRGLNIVYYFLDGVVRCFAGKDFRGLNINDGSIAGTRM